MTRAVELAQVASAGVSEAFKNRIINGAMVLDQRNNGASVTPTASTYTLDRWSAVLTQASKFSIQQNAGAVTPPEGFSNYIGITSTSAYSVAAGDAFLLAQYIEGFNTADLDFGKSTAKTVTISFWVRSSLTGTFGGVLNNSAFDRSYIFSYSIPVANTWTKISVTIAGDTTGTWIGATNGLGIAIRFGLGCGSNFTGTANSWQAGNLVQPTGSVSVVGTNGATWYITGVQLEVGSSATSFDYRPYGTEDYLCKRYYQKQSVTTFGTSDGSNTIFNGTYVPKRATPTNTYTVNFTIAGSGAQVDGYGLYSSGVTNNRNVDAIFSNAEL